MILLTGGAGFIGSHLADKLVAQGREIIILDDFNDYYSPEFKRQNIAELKANPLVKIIEGDISNTSLVEQIFKDHEIDKIIHMAARAGVRPSIENPLLYEQVNIGGTLNLLEAMRQFGCRDIYFASSSSVYGNRETFPFSETDSVDQPISPYAASKKAGELFAYTYHHLYDLNCVGFRFFTVYGERGRPDMAPYLFTHKVLAGEPIKKFGDGTTRRDYTYVDDIVSGILSVIDRKFGYEIFNLGNNQTVTLNELIETIEKHCGKKAIIDQYPKQPGDVDLTYADLTKSKKLLGYDPKTTIDEGISKFVAWFKKNRLKDRSKILNRHLLYL